MKKTISLICTCLLLILFVSGCGGSNDPHDVLKEALLKDADTVSVTVDGNFNMKMDTAGSASISIPGTFLLMIPNKLSSLEELQMYMKMGITVSGQFMSMQMWIKDGYLYNDDGERKTYTKLETDGVQIPPMTVPSAEDVEKYMSMLDPMTMTKDGKIRIIEATLSKEMFTNILTAMQNSGMSGEIPESIDLDTLGFENGKVTITVGEDKYISDISMEMSLKVAEVSASATVNMKLKDRNATSLPEFNKDEFADASSLFYLGAASADHLITSGRKLTVTCQDSDYHAYYNPNNEGLYFIRSDNEIPVVAVNLPSETAGQLVQYAPMMDGFKNIKTEELTIRDFKATLFSFEATEGNQVVEKGAYAILYLKDLENSLLFLGQNTPEELQYILKQLTYDINWIN